MLLGRQHSFIVAGCMIRLPEIRSVEETLCVALLPIRATDSDSQELPSSNSIGIQNTTVGNFSTLVLTTRLSGAVPCYCLLTVSSMLPLRPLKSHRPATSSGFFLSEPLPKSTGRNPLPALGTCWPPMNVCRWLVQILVCNKRKKCPVEAEKQQSSNRNGDQLRLAFPSFPSPNRQPDSLSLVAGPPCPFSKDTARWNTCS
ncbi:hypothetical protein F5Y17DRAFT_322650 [Xylariaceae sp. FL0594]|nr:hypothetical protein F5Y17DRAFT_322650 [Xylariaceae sp. FL0594]